MMIPFHKRNKLILFFVIMSIGASGSLSALQDSGHIENVEAVFIYHFIKYIQWGDKPADFAIGVLGETQVYEPLEEIAQRQSARQGSIRVFQIGTSAEIDQCQIVFVGRQEEKQFPEVVRQTQDKNILIVSAEEGALGKGSMINFLVLEGTVKFEINLRAMKKAGFKPSSELLKLAVRVIE